MLTLKEKLRIYAHASIPFLLLVALTVGFSAVILTLVPLPNGVLEVAVMGSLMSALFAVLFLCGVYANYMNAYRFDQPQFSRLQIDQDSLSLTD